MTRALKLLRWAISLFGVIGVILFGVLWVRSYWRADDIYSFPAGGQVAHSMLGSIALVNSPQGWRFRIGSESVADLTEGLDVDLIAPLRVVRLSGRVWRAPHWLGMVLFGLIAAAPWLRWRFSVRGVLILTAFLAAMFAILVIE